MDFNDVIELFDEAGWTVVDFNDQPGKYKLEVLDENVGCKINLEFGDEDTFTDELFIKALCDWWEDFLEQFYEMPECYGVDEEDADWFFECFRGDFDNLCIALCKYLEKKVKYLIDCMIPGGYEYCLEKEEEEDGV